MCSVSEESISTVALKKRLWRVLEMEDEHAIARKRVAKREAAVLYISILREVMAGRRGRDCRRNE